MPTHGCIKCPGCGYVCPLCSTCPCKPAEIYVTFNVVRPASIESIALSFEIGDDKNEEQKPETD